MNSRLVDPDSLTLPELEALIARRKKAAGGDKHKHNDDNDHDYGDHNRHPRYNRDEFAAAATVTEFVNGPVVVTVPAEGVHAHQRPIIGFCGIHLGAHEDKSYFRCRGLWVCNSCEEDGTIPPGGKWSCRIQFPRPVNTNKTVSLATLAKTLTETGPVPCKSRCPRHPRATPQHQDCEVVIESKRAGNQWEVYCRDGAVHTHRNPRPLRPTLPAEARFLREVGMRPGDPPAAILAGTPGPPPVQQSCRTSLNSSSRLRSDIQVLPRGTCEAVNTLVGTREGNNKMVVGSEMQPQGNNHIADAEMQDMAPNAPGPEKQKCGHRGYTKQAETFKHEGEVASRHRLDRMMTSATQRRAGQKRCTEQPGMNHKKEGLASLSVVDMLPALSVPTPLLATPLEPTSPTTPPPAMKEGINHKEGTCEAVDTLVGAREGNKMVAGSEMQPQGNSHIADAEMQDMAPNAPGSEKQRCGHRGYIKQAETFKHEGEVASRHRLDCMMTSATQRRAGHKKRCTEQPGMNHKKEGLASLSVVDMLPALSVPTPLLATPLEPSSPTTPPPAMSKLKEGINHKQGTCKAVNALVGAREGNKTVADSEMRPQGNNHIADAEMQDMAPNAPGPEKQRCGHRGYTKQAETFKHEGEVASRHRLDCVMMSATQRRAGHKRCTEQPGMNHKKEGLASLSVVDMLPALSVPTPLLATPLEPTSPTKPPPAMSKLKEGINHKQGTCKAVNTLVGAREGNKTVAGSEMQPQGNNHIADAEMQDMAPNAPGPEKQRYGHRGYTKQAETFKHEGEVASRHRLDHVMMSATQRRAGHKKRCTEQPGTNHKKEGVASLSVVDMLPALSVPTPLLATPLEPTSPTIPPPAMSKLKEGINHKEGFAFSSVSDMLPALSAPTHLLATLLEPTSPKCERAGRECIKKCEHASGECSKTPLFNFAEEGQKGRFCAEHKLEGMVDVITEEKQRRVAVQEGCVSCSVKKVERDKQLPECNGHTRDRVLRSLLTFGFGRWEPPPPKEWGPHNRDRVLRSLLTFGFGRWERIRREGGAGLRSVEAVEAFARAYVLQCGLCARHDGHEGQQGQKESQFVRDAIKAAAALDEAVRSGAKEFSMPAILQEERFVSKLKAGEARKALNRLDMLVGLQRRVDEACTKYREARHMNIFGHVDDQAEGVPPAVLAQLLQLGDVRPVWTRVTAWWDLTCDRHLLVGCFLHGFGKYERMKQDPNLCFQAKMTSWAKRHPGKTGLLTDPNARARASAAAAVALAGDGSDRESRFLGVYSQPGSMRWCAMMNLGEKKHKYLGAHDTEELAAKVYDAAVRQMFMDAPDQQVCNFDLEGNRNDYVVGLQNNNCQLPWHRASSYRGVRASGNKWSAQISYGGLNHHLGTYMTEIEAAVAYDSSARDNHSEGAILNFPNGAPQAVAELEKVLKEETDRLALLEDPAERDRARAAAREQGARLRKGVDNLRDGGGKSVEAMKKAQAEAAEKAGRHAEDDDIAEDREEDDGYQPGQRMDPGEVINLPLPESPRVMNKLTIWLLSSQQAMTLKTDLERQKREQRERRNKELMEKNERRRQPKEEERAKKAAALERAQKAALERCSAHALQTMLENNAFRQLHEWIGPHLGLPTEEVMPQSLLDRAPPELAHGPSIFAFLPRPYVHARDRDRAVASQWQPAERAAFFTTVLASGAPDSIFAFLPRPYVHARDRDRAVASQWQPAERAAFFTTVLASGAPDRDRDRAVASQWQPAERAAFFTTVLASGAPDSGPRDEIMSMYTQRFFQLKELGLVPAGFAPTDKAPLYNVHRPYAWEDFVKKAGLQQTKTPEQVASFYTYCFLPTCVALCHPEAPIPKFQPHFPPTNFPDPARPIEEHSQVAAGSAYLFLCRQQILRTLRHIVDRKPDRLLEFLVAPGAPAGMVGVPGSGGGGGGGGPSSAEGAGGGGPSSAEGAGPAVDGVPFWWCPWIHDYALVLGCLKHGYLCLNLIRSDKTLPLNQQKIQKHVLLSFSKKLSEMAAAQFPSQQAAKYTEDQRLLLQLAVSQFPSMETLDQRMKHICLQLTREHSRGHHPLCARIWQTTACKSGTDALKHTSSVFLYPPTLGGQVAEETKETAVHPAVRSQKRCEHAGCSRLPTYRFEGERKRRTQIIPREGPTPAAARHYRYYLYRFCGQHKLPGMVSMNKPRCKQPWCRAVAHFNVKGERRGAFCVKHKVEGMVNVRFIKQQREHVHRLKGTVDETMRKIYQQTGEHSVHVPSPPVVATSRNDNFVVQVAGVDRTTTLGAAALSAPPPAPASAAVPPSPPPSPPWPPSAPEAGASPPREERRGAAGPRAEEEERGGPRPCGVPAAPPGAALFHLGGGVLCHRGGLPAEFEGSALSTLVNRGWAVLAAPNSLMLFPASDQLKPNMAEGSFDQVVGSSRCAEVTSSEALSFEPKPNQCALANCKNWPGFNFKGQKRGIFCAQHKLQRMVRVNSRKCELHVKYTRCEQAGCSEEPYFNFEGEKKGRFCAQHTVQGMVWVKQKKRCQQADCSNFHHERGGRFCAQHKAQGMANLKSKKGCEHAGCNKRPHVNDEGQRGKFCGQHMPPGMIMEKVRTFEL